MGIPTALNTVNSDPTERNSTLALEKPLNGGEKKHIASDGVSCQLINPKDTNMLRVYGLTHKICFHFSYSLIIHKNLRTAEPTNGGLVPPKSRILFCIHPGYKT